MLPRIARLTPAGAAQLASDLAYLANIAAALNVDAPALERWRALAELSDADGRVRVREAARGKGGHGEGEGEGEGSGEGEGDGEGEGQGEVLVAMAKKRGWV